VARGFTVTQLAWTDPPLGGIDLPEGRLKMVAGFGSGLARRVGDTPEILWAVGDRGPNLKVDVAHERYGLRLEGAYAAIDGAKIMPRPDIGPALAELRLTGDRVELVRTLPVRGGSGRAISGLPGPGSMHAVTEPALDLAGNLLAPDPSGADSEGIVALADGGSIVGDEYGPSLLHLDAAATVIERWVPHGTEAGFAGADYPVRAVLPAIAVTRRLNRGFEGLALSPGGKRLHLAFQSPLAHPDERAHRRARHARIWTLDAATGAVEAQYLYPFDPPESFVRDEGAKWRDIKISEIVALADGSLLVLERVSATTKTYRVALTAPLPPEHLDIATRPTLEELSADGLDLPVLAKTLILDTGDVPEIGADLEGMVVLSPHDLLLVNDNDFGCEGVSTHFWRVHFDHAIFA
jgi:hypothetical protein